MIVEDEPAIAMYIGKSLKGSNYSVGATAFEYEDAIKELATYQPDVVLLDINLEGEKDGIHLAEFINENYGLPFLFITSYSNSRTIERVKITKPIGYLLKPFTEAELISTLEVSLFRYNNKSNTHLPAIESLNQKLISPVSRREYIILKGIFDGLNNQEIADVNFVSINTVKSHVRNLYSKFNVGSRWELLIELRGLV